MSAGRDHRLVGPVHSRPQGPAELDQRVRHTGAVIPLAGSTFRDRRRHASPPFLAACGLLLACPTAALAGMSAPLHANPGRYLRLGDALLLRLQAVSYFLLVFVL